MSHSPKTQLFLSASAEGIDPVAYSGELDASLMAVESEEELKPLGPVVYDLEVQVLGTELLVQGRIETRLELACARCADFYSTTLVDSAFVRCFDLAEAPEEVEIGEELREALLLQLPSFPLCKADCLGLCPVCGINLNRKSCSCEPEQSDDRWDVLDQLKG